MNYLGVLLILIGLYFSLGWVHSYLKQKYAWIDFYWASGLLIPLLWGLFFYSESFSHLSVVLISSAYLIWSLRLSLVLFGRIRKHSEDSRYVYLREYWGENQHKYFYVLYILEGLLVFPLALPFFLITQNPGDTISTLQVFGFVLFLVSISLEHISDAQLTKFKNANAGKKEVCNVGLWKYSRHPNYFFEILNWYAFGLIAIEISLLAIVPGVIMNILIYKVTGVPPSEEQSIRSRGEKYLNYSKVTNKLIPWLPGKEV